MKQIKRKKLVLSLIKDDLINSKLVYSLNKIGLEADQFNLHASITVMNLMRIKAAPLEWEEIHDGYLDLTRKVEQIDVQETRLLEALCEEIYDFLKVAAEGVKPSNLSQRII